LDLWLEDVKVELHEFQIHCAGHLAVYLPAEKILLAADMLEDPIWIFNFDFAPPETQLAEYERMMAMDIDRIYSSHCNLETVKAAGYDKHFIKNNANYLKRMIVDADHSDFGAKMAQIYIDDALAAGELTWWDPYSEIHARNIDTIKKIFQH
jgi:glyoxylase-like metal-dependent hydrolase (beta-lactamase superfamily II)